MVSDVLLINPPSGGRKPIEFASSPHLGLASIAAVAGEAGTEVVSPVGGGGVTNTFNISQLTVREEADVERIARELLRLQQLREVIHG